MKLETPIVRVFRGKTWLAVYRSVAVRIRCGGPMRGAPKKESVKNVTSNQKLFARSQLIGVRERKGFD